MPKTLPVKLLLKSCFLLFLFVTNGVLYAQTPVPYSVDNSGTDYTLVKAVGLPSGKSAVIFRDNSYNYKCSVVGSNGVVASTFDFTSKMMRQNTSNRIEVNALGTSSGNIWITYTSSTSDGPPNSINARYLVLDQSGTQVYSGTVNGSNLGTTLNRFIYMDQLSNGNVVMVWLQSDNMSGGYRIFNATGTPVTSDASFAGPASTIFNTTNTRPILWGNRVAANPNGGFLITFFYSSGNFQGILFDNNGTVQQVGGSNAFTIDPAFAGSYTNISALGLSNGNYMIAWAQNSSGTNTGYYKIISSAGSIIKSQTAFPANLQTDIANYVWVGAAANNTSSSPGFVIADYSWQNYDDWTNPYTKVVYYNFDLNGNYLSSKDASSYFIADFNGPTVSIYSGNPSGVGVAYANYKSFTPNAGGYTTSGLDISGSMYGFPGASLSNNATLSNLTISSGTLSPVFASSTTGYTASVSNATSSITVTPTVAESNATVTVNNTSVTSGSASGAVSLAVGANTITVKVTAQDGATTITYTITVNRAAASPCIATTGSFSGLNGTYGAPSGTGSITVSGTSLTAGITATISPSVFELSSDGITFASSLTLGSSGTVSGTIYVRLKSGTPAGTYTTGSVSLASTGANNPTVAIPSSTVNKASLTITAENKSEVYGSTIPVLTASYSGFVNGETSSILTTQPTLTTSATASSPVGNYAITASGAAALNYIISYQAGNLAVNPAPLTITANSVNKTYGQTLTGSSGSTAFTQSGLVNAETIGSVTITYGIGASAADAAGTYTGQVTPSAATGGTFAPVNYSITYAKGAIIVSAATATISFAAIPGKTYGNADFDPAATSTNTGTPITYTSSNTSVATIVSGKIHIVGAGTTIITAAQAASNGYSAAADVQQPLTVGKKSLTVTLNSTPGISKIYDGAATAILVGGNYTLNGVVGTDAVTVSGTATYDNANAGTGKTVTVNNFLLAGAQKDNYVLSTTGASTTGSISARPVVITANAQTKVYGLNDPALTYQVTGLLGTDALTGSLVRVPGENAGTYPIGQGTLAVPNGNYTIHSYQNGTLTVTPAVLTITANDQSKVYGASVPALTASYSGFVNGDHASDLATAPTLSTTATAASPVGNYAITASGAVAPNYTIIYTTGNLGVTPAALTITAEDKAKVYGAALPTLTASYSGFVNGDQAAGLTTQPAITTLATAFSGTGTYAITASGAASSNYSISYVSGTLTISAAQPVITFGSLPLKTYGDADFNAGAISDNTGTPVTYSSDNTSVAAIVNGKIHVVGAGTANITASQGADANHTAAANIIQQLTVNKKAITVVADAKNKTYGESDPALTYQLTSGALVGTDSFSGSLSRNAGEDAGSYAINQGTLRLSSNYTLTYNISYLTINKASITVAADAKTKIYGQSDPALTYQITSGALVGTDAFSGSLNRDGGENTGAYAIKRGTLTLNNNYSLSFNGADLTIDRASLTITAENKSKVYGSANPELIVSYSGFIDGENASSLTTAPALTTAATIGSPVGNYLITASGAAAANYIISYVSGNLSITKAVLTITADDQTKVYGQANPALTVSYSGFVNGDDASKLTAPAVAATTAGVASGTGSYDITVNGATSSDYTIVYNSGTLTVTPAVLVVTADDKTKVYGTANPALTVSYSGFVNGDDLSSLSSLPTAIVNATTTSGVGSYVITPSGGASDNYSFHYVDGNLSITQKTLTVNANAQTKVYGESDPALTYSVIGLVGSDAVTGSLVRITGNNVGAYAIQQGTLSAGNNYVVAYQGAALMITPKPVTVAADAKSKIYGQTDPAFTFNVSPALVSGDALSGVLNRTPGENAGTYSIQQGSLSNPNYAISFTGNVLTIDKASQQITWIQNLSMGCDGISRSTLTATASSGLPVSYSSANASIAAINGNEVVMTGAGTVILTAAQGGNQNYLPAAPVTNTLINKLPSSMVVKRWNDVLVFDNSTGQYMEWQWYKNGTAISGATGQYYYESGKLNGAYTAVAKTKTGETQQTCPLTITPGNTIIPIAVFPNPAAPGQTVIVKTEYSSTELQGATIVVTNVLGVVVQTVQNVTQQTNVTMPVAQGIYVIRLRLANGVTASVNALVKPQ